MGYMRGLTHGAVAGAILAFLYAPDSGANTRRRVSRLLGPAEAMLSSDSGAERFVTGLLIGVAVGFGLALLLAPKSGEELRDDLMQRGIELRDRAGELASRRPFGDGEQGRTEKASSDQPGTA